MAGKGFDIVEFAGSLVQAQSTAVRAGLSAGQRTAGQAFGVCMDLLEWASVDAEGQIHNTGSMEQLQAICTRAREALKNKISDVSSVPL